MKIECTVEELKELLIIKKEQIEFKSECSSKDLQYLRDIAEKSVNNLIGHIEKTLNDYSLE